MTKSSIFLESGNGLIIPATPIQITEYERKIGLASIRALNENRPISEILKEEGIEL